MSSKLSDSSALLNDLSKTIPSHSSPQLMKHKRSPSSSVTCSPIVKRQKTFEASPQPVTSMSMQQQQQQLLWEMTQQLMMSAAGTDPESLAAVNSSLLKQQLLGLTQTETVAKQKTRPSKPLPQSPVMHSNSSLNSNASHSSTSTSPFERGGFAPRRRGRPPKYVTDRALAGLSSLDLDPSTLTASYDQLLSAIENGMGASASGASSAAFQTALASMLGQQAGLSIPPAPAARKYVTCDSHWSWIEMLLFVVVVHLRQWWRIVQVKLATVYRLRRWRVRRNYHKAWPMEVLRCRWWQRKNVVLADHRRVKRYSILIKFFRPHNDWIHRPVRIIFHQRWFHHQPVRSISMQPSQRCYSNSISTETQYSINLFFFSHFLFTDALLR